MKQWLAVGGIICGVSCSPSDQPQPGRTPSRQTHTSSVDPRVRQWHDEQKQQECPDVRPDEKAKSLVREAQEAPRRVKVFGPPSDSRQSILGNLWSRPNPHGQGTLVTASQMSGGSADHRIRRAVWLVLDGVVYPLNVDAARAVSVLLDSTSIPPSVLKKAGLNTPIDIERDFGIEEFALFRWHGSDNPLPACPSEQ